MWRGMGVSYSWKGQRFAFDLWPSWPRLAGTEKSWETRVLDLLFPILVVESALLGLAYWCGCSTFRLETACDLIPIVR